MQSKAYRTQFLILSLIAFLGILCSAFLTHHFYELRNGTGSFQSFCNVNQSFNCDVVAASSFSEFAFGLPLSSFATGWFLALLCISGLGQSYSWRAEATRAAFGMSLLGTALSLVYLAIMAFKLKTFCIQCLFIDGLNVAALLLTLSLKPQSLKTLKPNWDQWKTFAGTVVVSLLISVVGLASFDQINIKSSEVNEMVQQVLSSPALSLPSMSEAPSIGPRGAPITIMEFSDFQCPYCRIGAQILNTLHNRYPQWIRIEFHNFPLDPKCNPEIKNSAHDTSCEAAKTVLCAHKQGKFKETFEAMFENQSSLKPGRPLQIATDLGLNLASLQSCTASQETQNEILKDVQQGTAVHLTSTPTFFINGHRMEGPYPIPVWDKIIRRLLEESGHAGAP